jgi:hypothetical protein
MNPIFTKAKSLISGRNLSLLAVVVLALLLLRQCGISDDAKKEAERSLHNLLAEQDSVRTIKSKLGNVLVEKSAFQLKYSELSSDQKELIAQLELEKNKRPGVVIETQVVYKDTSIVVPVNTQIKDGVSYLSFIYNPSLPGSNKLSVGGKLPYTIKSDTLPDGSFSSDVVPGQVNLSIEQRIDLVTGLYRDPKTNRLYVRASTSFPGITFNDIQALDMVDDPGTRKALKGARKPFALGFNVGYGMVLSPNGYSTGPTIGVGLNYSPKFLQFGK